MYLLPMANVAGYSPSYSPSYFDFGRAISRNSVRFFKSLSVNTPEYNGINILSMTFKSKIKEDEFQESLANRRFFLSKYFAVMFALLTGYALVTVSMNNSSKRLLLFYAARIPITLICLYLPFFCKWQWMTVNRMTVIIVNLNLIGFLLSSNLEKTHIDARDETFSIFASASGLVVTIVIGAVLQTASVRLLCIVWAISGLSLYDMLMQALVVVDSETEVSLKHKIQACVYVLITISLAAWFTQYCNYNLRMTFICNRNAANARHETHLAVMKSERIKNEGMQSKIDVMSNLAHDTGNSIMIMEASTIQLIEYCQSSPAITPCLEVMKLCITILESARQRSLDCARSKDGEYQNPKYAPVELYPLLKDLNGIANLFLARSEVQFIFQIEASLMNHPIYSSREWLCDMLLNYIINASKYTESGRIVVSIYQVDGGKGICLEVSDTGTGILDKYKPLLFNKFARVETIMEEEEEEKWAQCADQPMVMELEQLPTVVDKVKRFFSKSSVYPSDASSRGVQRQQSESVVSLSSMNDIESLQSNQFFGSGRQLNPPKKNLKGTGLGLFGVVMKALKFGGYVSIEDNSPRGVVASFIIPNMQLANNMRKIERETMDEAINSLPRDDVNESGVCLPPPNPNRLHGITFIEITGAIDSQALDFSAQLPPVQHPQASRSQTTSSSLVLNHGHLASISSDQDSKESKKDIDTSNWPSILVIDDSSSIRMTWAGMMRKKNHKVVGCENGETGLAAMKEKVFSFVVMDMQMPKMNGVQAILAIREHERHLWKTGKNQQVIVFCSGGMGAELEQKAKRAGADIVAPKPSPFSLLFDDAIKLREALDSSE